ncbi:cuticle protein 19-like [Pollicipes pollicipes]|uniref:cuticle protein 19-like n=1 Tax=Pollicipes pollicipes TaxID=41117 RepID=UPI0018849CD2|nr:cuticle protein 19-like [Pollicipes pollicipes]
MKLIILTTLVAAAAGGLVSGNLGGPYGGQFGGPFGGQYAGSYGGPFGGAHGGVSGAYGGDYYAVPDYSTAYSVKDPYSGVDVDKQENRLGHKTEGSYSVLLPDGRKQVVTYWVDGKSGYNADVKYFGVAKHPKKPIAHGIAHGIPHGAGFGGIGPAGLAGPYGGGHIY